jgi:hypothetical protein
MGLADTCCIPQLIVIVGHAKNAQIPIDWLHKSSDGYTMAFRGGITLSATLLLAVFSLVCVFWTNPLHYRSNRLTELEAPRSTSLTAALISSKGRTNSALPQRVHSVAQRIKPVQLAAVQEVPEVSHVASMTMLQSEGDLSPTTQNEIDIIENNMNYLRDQMDKVSDQLTAEHDFMQVIFILTCAMVVFVVAAVSKMTMMIVVLGSGRIAACFVCRCR